MFAPAYSMLLNISFLAQIKGGKERAADDKSNKSRITIRHCPVRKFEVEGKEM